MISIGLGWIVLGAASLPVDTSSVYLDAFAYREGTKTVVVAVGCAPSSAYRIASSKKQGELTLRLESDGSIGLTVLTPVIRTIEAKSQDGFVVVRNGVSGKRERIPVYSSRAAAIKAYKRFFKQFRADQ